MDVWQNKRLLIALSRHLPTCLNGVQNLRPAHDITNLTLSLSENRHHVIVCLNVKIHYGFDLVDRQQISITQMTMDISQCRAFKSVPIIYWLWLTSIVTIHQLCQVSNTTGTLVEQELLTFSEHLNSPQFFVGFV